MFKIISSSLFLLDNLCEGAALLHKELWCGVQPRSSKGLLCADRRAPIKRAESLISVCLSHSYSQTTHYSLTIYVQ